MTRQISFVAAAAAIALFPASAFSQTYCRPEPFRYLLGQPASTTMKVVASTVVRPVTVPGRTPNEGWCNIAVNSGAPFYRPIEVVQKPSKGELRTGSYGVTFRSKAVGPDMFSYKLHQYHPRNNQQAETLITVKVDVVPAPF